MKRFLLFVCAVVLVIFGIPKTSNATLIDRGGGLIYCDSLDITWLQDAMYPKTSDYILDGLMQSYVAKSWAENLEYYDSVRDVTWDDWRLPSAYNQDGSGPDSGWNVTGNEMGHLYYTELENVGGGPLTNTGPFINLQPHYYWTGTEYDENAVWAFHFNVGGQWGNYRGFLFHAWAVRDGDVGLPPTLIELAQFNAIPQKDQIAITWTTASETDNAGFNLLRSESKNGEYIKSNPSLIEAVGGASWGSEYFFTDDTAETGALYFYKLEDIDNNGKSTFHEPVSATVPASKPTKDYFSPYWFRTSPQLQWPVNQYPAYDIGCCDYSLWWLYPPNPLRVEKNQSNWWIDFFGQFLPFGY